MKLGVIENRSMATCSIRAHVNAFDAANAEEQDELKIPSFRFNNVYLGSRVITSLDNFIRDANGDAAFTAFNSRLTTCLNELRAQEGRGRVRVKGTDKVST